MNVVSFLNPKGGVGKTTLTINVARALELAGERVLIIDSDPQGSARDWSETAGPGSVPVVGLDRPNIHEQVPTLGEGYQWVIIDGAAKLERMVVSALRASDLVIIPVQASPLDIWAAQDLVELVQSRQAIADGRPTAAFVVSRLKHGTRVAREVRDVVAEYGLPLLAGAIHDRTAYAQTLAEGRTAVDMSGPAHHEIERLVDQIREAFRGA